MILVRPGDLLISGINAAKGAIAIYDESASEPAAATIHYGAYIPNPENVDVRFLWWMLRSRFFQELLFEYVPGGIKTELKAKRLLPIPVPLPPLSEQRRILMRIKELATQIREARTLREQAAKEADALIAASVSMFCFNESEIGRFEEYLIESKNGIYKPPFAWGHGTPCLRMYNIDGPTLNMCNLQLLDVSKEELENYGCIEGDLIFNRVNSADLVGKTGIVPAEFPQATFESKNMRLRVNRTQIIPEFAARVLNSAPTRRYYRNVLKQQCGMATLNQEHVRNIPFPRLSLSEQRIRITEMDALQTEVDSLKRMHTDTSAELNALLPAILDRAFKGELL